MLAPAADTVLAIGCCNNHPGYYPNMATDHEIELSCDRLLLRPFRLEDAEAICDAVLESIEELLPWLPWCHRQYKIDETRAFLEGRASAFENDTEYAFAIVEQGTARLIGACGVNQIDAANARANLGYWVRTGATRRGYATDATRLLAQWAFEALDLVRIEIVAAVGNEASQRVAAKAGACREGIARWRLNVRGEFHDAVVFSLLREDAT
jgi:RimJ/RimL family protein N-acetyltransferase